MTDKELYEALGIDRPVTQNTKYYAGIGSRETPESVKPMIKKIVELLESKGYVLRSGGANGADKFFESYVSDLKEIYLPWKGFNGNASPLYTISEAAREMGKRFHPANLTKDAVINLMARNCYQVLGKDLKTPSDFIICWTPDGKASGGTGQAIRIADHYNIPVYNLKNTEDLQRLGNLLDTL